LGSFRAPQSNDQQLPRTLEGLRRLIREVVASIVPTVLPIVQNSAAQITALLGNYLTIASAAATYALLGHKHSWSDITTTGTTGAGGTVGGDLTITGTTNGQQAVFPTGVRSTGARNNQVTTNYVAMYVDGNGNFGFAPSTRASKDVGTPYAVNMPAFLSATLFNWQYKNGGMKGIGPMADDLLAAGLTEFLTFDADGNVQGLRYEALTIGLWSAYVQSRTSTLARIANQRYQYQTIPLATVLSIGASKSYPVTWTTPFIDANYSVSANVYTSAGVLVAGASAASLPSQRTATGCTVQVSTGVALLATMTIVVEATHI
jgi:hypothetical protein